jgi:hypothetical protein
MRVDNLVIPEDDEDYWEEEREYSEDDGCCEECHCYHGHHPWCSESDEVSW